MLAEDVEVVALGVERRDVALGALPPVVAVVVVGAEVGDLVLAEHPHEAAGDRGLPGPGVADDAEHHRPRHQRYLPWRRSVRRSGVEIKCNSSRLIS